MAKLGGIIESTRNSLEIETLARFVVDEHNKKAKTRLVFGKVVNAKQQVVAGIKYYITLEVTDGGKKKVYEAQVAVKLWLNFKELLEFKLIGDA